MLRDERDILKYASGKVDEKPLKLLTAPSTVDEYTFLLSIVCPDQVLLLRKERKDQQVGLAHSSTRAE